MPERFRCAVTSAERGEDLAGTASTVRRWVLVEQPGSWGIDAVTESALPLDVALPLRERARRVGARTLLIRRARTGRRRTVYTAWSGPAEAWVEQHHVDDPDQLLDLPLDGLRSGQGTGGRRITEPLVLTCTNGRHDACCAVFGRPIARAFEALLDDHAWEVSHIGGDRFAPNVLVLPHGLYHGRLTLAQVPELARAAGEGRVLLPAYRGRSVHPFPVQAAEAAFRRRHGDDVIDRVVVTGWGEHDDAVLVQIRHGDAEWEVAVEAEPSADAWPLTCRAQRSSRPPVYRVSSIDHVAVQP